MDQKPTEIKSGDKPQCFDDGRLMNLQGWFDAYWERTLTLDQKESIDRLIWQDRKRAPFALRYELGPNATRWKELFDPLKDHFSYPKPEDVPKPHDDGNVASLSDGADEQKIEYLSRLKDCEGRKEVVAICNDLGLNADDALVNMALDPDEQAKRQEQEYTDFINGENLPEPIDPDAALEITEIHADRLSAALETHTGELAEMRFGQRRQRLHEIIAEVGYQQSLVDLERWFWAYWRIEGGLSDSQRRQIQNYIREIGSDEGASPSEYHPDFVTWKALYEAYKHCFETQDAGFDVSQSVKGPEDTIELDDAGRIIDVRQWHAAYLIGKLTIDQRERIDDIVRDYPNADQQWNELFGQFDNSLFCASLAQSHGLNIQPGDVEYTEIPPGEVLLIQPDNEMLGAAVRRILSEPDLVNAQQYIRLRGITKAKSDEIMIVILGDDAPSLEDEDGLDPVELLNRWRGDVLRDEFHTKMLLAGNPDLLLTLSDKQLGEFAREALGGDDGLDNDLPNDGFDDDPDEWDPRDAADRFDKRDPNPPS